MIELENPQIEPVEDRGTVAKYEAGPLQAGYGVTIGNALRRVLLSSLEGAAVTAIQIRDVYQEFSTIPGVKEDVTQIVLNVKKLRLKSFATHPVQLKLVKSGAGPVTAADIAESADVEIANVEGSVRAYEQMLPEVRERAEAPIPMKIVWIAYPRVRCSSGSMSPTKARNGSMVTFNARSSSQKAGTATHSTVELGSRTSATVPTTMRYHANTPKPCRLMKRTNGFTTTSAARKATTNPIAITPPAFQSSVFQFL